jgi:hypothetical protein
MHTSRRERARRLTAWKAKTSGSAMIQGRQGKTKKINLKVTNEVWNTQNGRQQKPPAKEPYRWFYYKAI